MKKILIVAALALTAAACGGSSKKTTPSSNASFACDMRTADALCLEASAPAAMLTAADYTAAACTDPANGGVVIAACPATARVGRCSITEAAQGGSIAVVWHVYSPATAADGSAFCAAIPGGTWTAG